MSFEVNEAKLFHQTQVFNCGNANLAHLEGLVSGAVIFQKMSTDDFVV